MVILSLYTKKLTCVSLPKINKYEDKMYSVLFINSKLPKSKVPVISFSYTVYQCIFLLKQLFCKAEAKICLFLPIL